MKNADVTESDSRAEPVPQQTQPIAQLRWFEHLEADVEHGHEDGEVAGGWTASEFLEGEPAPAGRWASLMAVGRAFHEALREVPRPDLLDRRNHPWAVADRVAWADAAPSLPGEAGRALAALLELRGPVEAPDQLIHGDLTGNVLFHPGQRPAVIDFSPYWRPARYAEAIVTADALLYHGAGPELAGGGEDVPLLVRALIFRLVALCILTGRDGALPEGEPARFAGVTALVRTRAGER
ncbi:phosphotransferase [Nonomuraea sp. LPB2021202275-12-8]|uniref:phosphotransferase n=1 Tax=Nonomuraea sp. LPB2021202275-12-8 TaxID=3120159 RepID=UPI00300C9291